MMNLILLRILGICVYVIENVWFGLFVKEEEAGVEGDGRDVEEVEDEAVEAVVATRSRWSSSRRRRMYIYSYVNGEFHVWCWHEAAYTVTRCSCAIR